MKSQLTIFNGTTLSHLHSWAVKSQPPTLGKLEVKRRRGQQEEMVGWHHQLSGHEFEQTLGDSEGQGSLVYCSPWGHNELDTTATEQQQLHVSLEAGCVGFWMEDQACILNWQLNGFFKKNSYSLRSSLFGFICL